MKRINTLCALVFAVMLIPDVVMAQACPGTNHEGNELKGKASSSGFTNNATADLYNFIGTAGCSGMAFGATQPWLCGSARFTGRAELYANWLVADEPATPSLNGCSFNCGGKICQVRGGDGLPVELMEFSVDE
jgi:hypothetical protein